MKAGTPITKNRERENSLITIIPLHIRESSKMECPMEKVLPHQKLEHNFKLNGLMVLMLVFYDLIF